MLDKAWLESALELQKKMKDLAEHSWHFDKSWLDKAMEMQKMATGPGIDPAWYKEMLGGIMKGYPGSGLFNFQEADAQPVDANEAEQVSPAPRFHSKSWQPQFTITETGGQIILNSYIPGIRNKEDLSIRLHGSILYVSGKSQGAVDWQGQAGEAEEFYREIRLPADVRSEGTSACYTKGSLTIKIPKTKPASIEPDFSL